MVGGLYRQVTDAVLAQIAHTNGGDWICPWHGSKGGLPINGTTGHRYRGINILNLWCAAATLGFADHRWATYRQWQAQGAQVRKGEKGSLVLFYKEIEPAGVVSVDQDRAAERRYVLRSSVVFNSDQVDGVKHEAEPTLASRWITEDFDEFVGKTRAAIRFGGTQAFYSPSSDEICLPEKSRFKDPEGYMATLGHELVHWTGAKTRLSRDLSSRFGKRSYAAEELIAELGSAFLLAGLGQAIVPHQNHASYIASWLPLLREDPRAIFVAAAQASRAVDWLFEITSASTGDDEDASVLDNRVGNALFEPAV
ncbi:ArdC family protein [Mesorhizobium sp. 128a]